MAGFIEGVSRAQTALFPEWLDDWIASSICLWSSSALMM
jgi:hypothetical protein